MRCGYISRGFTQSITLTEESHFIHSNFAFDSLLSVVNHFSLHRVIYTQHLLASKFREHLATNQNSSMNRISLNFSFACLLIMLSQEISAQTTKASRTPLELKTVVDKPGKKAFLEFSFPEEEDVLILVTDSVGITIFLENKHRFKGKYSRTIDLPGKGPFNLNVSRMNENINRKLEVR